MEAVVAGIGRQAINDFVLIVIMADILETAVQINERYIRALFSENHAFGKSKWIHQATGKSQWKEIIFTYGKLKRIMNVFTVIYPNNLGGTKIEERKLMIKVWLGVFSVTLKLITDIHFAFVLYLYIFICRGLN